MQLRTLTSRAMAVAALSLLVVACGDDEDDSSPPATQAPSTEAPMVTDASMSTEAPMMTDSTMACDADSIVAMVEGGAEAGTLAGMASDPVGTAASNNPVLTTLTAAVTAAGLVDTLNSAPELTVFAPTDCAFAALDPATLEAAMADPQGLLTTVLGYHVITERLDADELGESPELETFTGELLKVDGMGDQITLADGQAAVVVGEIQTSNATVYLIDHVLIPPSVG
jgi:uncharacterized surface protein with fasciclin (FAS1) repeats